jgi:hypothetical protein
VDQNKAEDFAQESLKKMIELEVNMFVSHDKDSDKRMKETADSIGQFYRHLCNAYLNTRV